MPMAATVLTSEGGGGYSSSTTMAPAHERPRAYVSRIWREKKSTFSTEKHSESLIPLHFDSQIYVKLIKKMQFKHY
jgi:hypothetical protein